MLLEFNSILPFLLAAISITLLPGPDNLFVLSTSAVQGVKAGIPTALGMAAGNFIHTLAVAIGLAAVIAASPMGLDWIKTLGIAYLLYLAWKSWQAAPQKKQIPSVENIEDISVFDYFKRGF